MVTHASTPGTALPGSNAATISMERSLEIKAAVHSPCQTTAALSPLVLASTTAMAQIQAMCGSTPGMALPGFSAVARSMEKRLVTPAALQSPLRRRQNRCHWRHWKRRQWQLLRPYTSLPGNGTDWVQIGTDIDGEDRADFSGWAVPSQTTASLLPLVQITTTTLDLPQAMCGCSRFPTPPLPLSLLLPPTPMGPRLSSPTTWRSLQQRQPQLTLRSQPMAR